MSVNNSSSEFHAEREAILDVMRENDRETWQRFQACNLVWLNPMHNTLTAILEKQLEEAGKLKFEGEWDEARVAQIEVYSTIYHICGFDAEAAKEKAEELAEEVGLRGLRALF